MRTSRRGRVRSCSSFVRLAALSLAVATPAARAASPAREDPGGLLVAESPRCRVELTKVSYDDPGADDAEFIELRVPPSGPGATASSSTGTPAAACASGSPHPVPSADGGSGSDSGRGVAARVDGGSVALTLGSCGLSELQLVDGNAGGCAPYRSVPLADVPVGRNGIVTLCPAGSVLDVTYGCDVSTAGHAALRGGWLQNGPTDGLRFIGVHGAVVAEVAYEGAPSCFASSSASLVAETGEVTGIAAAAPMDDVNVFCDGRFVLLSEAQAPLGARAECPPQPDDGGVLSGLAEASSGTGAPSPEGTAPRATRPPLGSVPGSYLDAGTPPKKVGRTLPKPPGCSVTQLPHPGHSSDGLYALVALATSAAVTRRRRTLPGPAPRRADSSARCGSVPRR